MWPNSQDLVTSTEEILTGKLVQWKSSVLVSLLKNNKWTDITHYSGISNVEFEQVYSSWEVSFLGPFNDGVLIGKLTTPVALLTTC